MCHSQLPAKGRQACQRRALQKNSEMINENNFIKFNKKIYIPLRCGRNLVVSIFYVIPKFLYVIPNSVGNLGLKSRVFF